MPGDPYKLQLLHANCTCGDCAHFKETFIGSNAAICPEAAEALSLEGWPKVTVFVEWYSSAESCPSFEPAQDGPSRPGWEERVDELYQESKEDAMEEHFRCMFGQGAA